VAVVVCDPHHPQQNGFIERYHRTYGEECLSRHRPTTFEQVREVTEAFVEHYNWQRPHQGIACGNRPPRVAFPDLPTLRSVPDVVNADAWLSWVDGEHVVRLVNRQGFVKVDLRTYYVSSKLAGQAVTLRVNATEGCLQVMHPQGNQRSLPLKGLYQRSFSYQDYVELMGQEASTRTSLARLTEASHPSEWELFSLTRCWEAAPVTRLGSHTVGPIAIPTADGACIPPKTLRCDSSSSSHMTCSIKTWMALTARRRKY
jgi:hypothetical protein